MVREGQEPVRYSYRALEGVLPPDVGVAVVRGEREVVLLVDAATPAVEFVAHLNAALSVIWNPDHWVYAGPREGASLETVAYVAGPLPFGVSVTVDDRDTSLTVILNETMTAGDIAPHLTRRMETWRRTHMLYVGPDAYTPPSSTCPVDTRWVCPLLKAAG